MALGTVVLGYIDRNRMLEVLVPATPFICHREGQDVRVLPSTNIAMHNRMTPCPHASQPFILFPPQRRA